MEGCIFCLENGISRGNILARNDHCYLIESADPNLLDAGLIMPYRHVASPFDLTVHEWKATHDLVKKAKEIFDIKKPAGYNLGWNVGTDAGQHVPHAHLHIILRFSDEPLAGKGIRHAFKQESNRRRGIPRD